MKGSRQVVVDQLSRSASRTPLAHLVNVRSLLRQGFPNPYAAYSRTGGREAQAGM